MELDVFPKEVNESLIATHETVKQLVFKLLLLLLLLLILLILHNQHVNMWSPHVDILAKINQALVDYLPQIHFSQPCFLVDNKNQI